MNGNRQVESLQFRGSYAICAVPCNDQLSIQKGTVDVWPGVTATINADTAVGVTALTKRNQGSRRGQPYFIGIVRAMRKP